MRNCARRLKNTVSLQRKPQLHQKPPLPCGQPNERKNSNFHQTDYVKTAGNLTPPTESQTNGIKREFTERNSSKQRAMVAPTHNHAENFENFQELTLCLGASFTRPHGGRLMILPVDQNAGNCLVKGSTCAPLRTSVPLRDPPQEPAKKQSGAAAADRTPTPKSVTVSPNTKRTRTVQILSHSKLYNSQA